MVKKGGRRAKNMIELGKKQYLYVVKKTPMGIFLNENPESLLNNLPLPRQEVAELEDVAVGDQLAVYCHMDFNNKLVVTLKAPIICQGEIGLLETVGSNHYGAFLYWGYEKDILLPFSEQNYPIKKGYKVMVGIYIDKSGRLCATQKVRRLLSSNHSYEEGEQVKGIIYEISEEYGAFVAVDRKYFALILVNELLPYMKVGLEVEGRITKVREDGKMNITLNKPIREQMDQDSMKILEVLEKNKGFLPYNDKTDSDTIKQIFSMSKKAFKRGIGKLYRERHISIESDGIQLQKGEDESVF